MKQLAKMSLLENFCYSANASLNLNRLYRPYKFVFYFLHNNVIKFNVYYQPTFEGVANLDFHVISGTD